MRPKIRSYLKFGEQIRKNTENSEKYLGKFGKILKIRKNTRKNSEKYRKFGKILWKIRKNSLGKIDKIRKNRKKSEKYFWKFGKILNNSEKYSRKFGKILSKIRIPDAKSLFPTMPLIRPILTPEKNQLEFLHAWNHPNHLSLSL